MPNPAKKATELKRTLSEDVHYPEHFPRKPTALYTATHHKLVDELDRPCLVCGVRKSTLKDPAINIWGATAIETHHYIIEDSLANAIDLAKFNTHIVPGMLKRWGDDRYKVPFTQDQMIEWIHGDEHAMWCICSTHHRHNQVGIHAITYPIWTVQNLLMDGFDLTGFKPVSPQEGKALEALPNTTGTTAKV